MTTARADILSILNISRNEFFTSSVKNTMTLTDEKEKPIATVYFKDGHFTVRFGIEYINNFNVD